MSVKLCDTRIISQSMVLHAFEGPDQAEILEAVAKHVREDPSHPIVRRIEVLETVAPSLSYRAEVMFYLPPKVVQSKKSVVSKPVVSINPSNDPVWLDNFIKAVCNLVLERADGNFMAQIVGKHD